MAKLIVVGVLCVFFFSWATADGRIRRGVPDAGGKVPDTGKVKPDTGAATDLTKSKPNAKGTVTSITSQCFKNKPEAVDDLDEKWVEAFGKSGVYNRVSYKLKTWGVSTKQAKAPETNKKAKNQKCWDVRLKTPSGLSSELNNTMTTCTYGNDVAREKCTLSSKSLAVLNSFAHWGDFIVVKYNDEEDISRSYILCYVCLLGSEDYFFTIMKSDHTTPLPDDIKEEIVDKVIELGFKKEEIIYDANDKLAIQYIRLRDSCPGSKPDAFKFDDKFGDMFSGFDAFGGR